MPRLVTLVLLTVVWQFWASSASALTQEEFTRICASHEGDCAEVPVLQAYVGGALDLIATLDERTDYLATVYCRPPSELFDVATIIRYIAKRADREPEANAMLGMIRYLETEGGCPPR